jgi:hypothetical protein
MKFTQNEFIEELEKHLRGIWECSSGSANKNRLNVSLRKIVTNKRPWPDLTLWQSNKERNLSSWVGYLEFDGGSATTLSNIVKYWFHLEKLCESDKYPKKVILFHVLGGGHALEGRQGKQDNYIFYREAAKNLAEKMNLSIGKIRFEYIQILLNSRDDVTSSVQKTIETINRSIIGS